MINQTVALLQMYILTQLGCRSKKFHKNELKKTTQGCHWGYKYFFYPFVFIFLLAICFDFRDLRAALELAIQKVTEIATKYQNYQRPATLNPYNSDEEDVDVSISRV